MKAVILAGGKGTRMGTLTQEIPKPMIKVAGKTIIEHQIEGLKKSGVKDIIFIIGHLGEKIQEYFGDGKNFGVNIQYILEKKPLGTAGALYFLKDIITEDFLLLYGDIMLDIDFTRLIDFHLMKNSLATLFVHPNSHPYDSDLVSLNCEEKVINIDLKTNIRDYHYSNCVNSGVYVVNKKLLEFIDKPVKLDFEKDVLFQLVLEGRAIYGYKSTEYVKDMGTPDRLKEVTEAYTNGIIKKRNLRNKQKCVFLDRDGTINVHKGLLYQIEDFELEDGVAEAINSINTSEYICIVITNQPVVARNLCTIEEVENIHKKMETLLGKKGAYLDDIFFCPHHPDKGYEGENPLYKIDCNCRKPKTEFIDYCLEKYNIDIRESYFIGDTTVDIKTGINADLQTILLKTGEAGKDKRFDVIPNYTFNNLKDAIDSLIL